ncbi:MAG: tRNA lysidine(34) synthetase TilS [Actinobacteria bacterium]|nr:tRNA lysidine(34) synthetase TilS [Actinomycetota bacterium]
MGGSVVRTGGLDPAVAAVRLAVRRAFADHVVAGERVLVGISGGADSLALAAAVAFEAPRIGLAAGAVTVDHGLQPGSAGSARRAAAAATALGLTPVRLCTVQVTVGGGPEAAARRARQAALRATAEELTASWVLLGHTLDDQAETVLLGLGRGSGPRSIAGMRVADRPWLRPLLGLRRRVTSAACAAQDLVAWQDPHNADPRFRRARLRHEALPVLEDVLGGGVAEALARTAELVRADVQALDDQADRLAGERLAVTADRSVPVHAFEGVPEALRRRLVRIWLADVPGLTAAHITAVDDLIVGWHGQGPVWLPRATVVTRRHGRLHRATEDVAT